MLAVYSGIVALLLFFHCTLWFLFSLSFVSKCVVAFVDCHSRYLAEKERSGPKIIKLYFILSSTEHEILSAH